MSRPKSALSLPIRRSTRWLGIMTSAPRTQGIALEWNAAVPEALPIADAELCVLLGNLLENAIDGASALPEGERRVRAICRLSGDMLCVIVENRFDGQVRREKGRFLSTKHAGRGARTLLGGGGGAAGTAARCPSRPRAAYSASAC